MSVSDYPNPTGSAFQAPRPARELSAAGALAVIGGGSALIWGLIGVAIWQLI